MDSALSPAYKRQAALLIVIMAGGLVLTYFFGLLIGLAMNTGMLVAVALYVRKKRTGALKSFGFGSDTAGRGQVTDSVRLKFICLQCGAQVNGARCTKCGSSMKKPVF
jgi:hypothetical protein